MLGLILINHYHFINYIYYLLILNDDFDLKITYNFVFFPDTFRSKTSSLLLLNIHPQMNFHKIHARDNF